MRIEKTRLKAIMSKGKVDDMDIEDVINLVHADDEFEGNDIYSMDNAGNYTDDVKGGSLDPAEVLKARAEEMSYISKHKLYDKVPRSLCYEKTGKAPIRSGWVDTNKGTSKEPNFRSRWVAKEYRRNACAELFAVAPPLEALRMLLSRGASAQGRGTCLGVVDVRRAYFYAPP